MNATPRATRSIIHTELRELWALAVPIIVTQLAQMGLTVVDTLMIGRVGVFELDAVALGQLWIWGTGTLAMGCVMGFDPVVAHAHGAGDALGAGRALQRGLVLALALGVYLAVAWTFTEQGLGWLGQPPRLAAQSGEYLRAQAWSAPFMPLYVALNQYLIARGITWPGLRVALLSNVLNAVLNAALIFGSPLNEPLGVFGAALATSLTRALQLVWLVLLTRRARLFDGAWPAPHAKDVLDRRALRDLFWLGLPVGLQYTLEVWAFHAGTVMAGHLGEVPLAAHSIVLNAASLTFMVPLGVSIAVAMRVGNLLGAGQAEQAGRVAWLAVASAAGAALVACSVFALLPTQVARLYTDASAVITLTATRFPIAAAFQIADAIQAVGGGVLRGMGRPRPAAVFNFVGYFGVALPFAYWLVFERGHGVVGIWCGYALGLWLVALALVTRIALRGPAQAAKRLA